MRGVHESTKRLQVSATEGGGRIQDSHIFAYNVAAPPPYNV